MATHGKYKGYTIQSNEEGFFWEAGCWHQGGYFDTIEETRIDIDYYIKEEMEHYPVPYDTPCLGTPWWNEQ
jgi:hypothetical protein